MGSIQVGYQQKHTGPKPNGQAGQVGMNCHWALGEHHGEDLCAPMRLGVLYQDCEDIQWPLAEV